MKKQQNFTRREAIKIGAGTGISLTLGSLPSMGSIHPRKDNRIILENQKEGTTDWQLTRVRPDKDLFRTPYIEGYCSKQSYKTGEKLDIMVSASPAESYKIDFYRTGYYSGTGGRLVHSIGPLSGKPQPTPSAGEKDLHECSWEVATSLVIPEEWISGVYLGKLQTLPKSEEEPYWESYIIFIVKDDRPVDVLFQCSDNTWQAYNRWPNNYSLYTHPDGVQGPWAQVGCDRHYGRQ